MRLEAQEMDGIAGGFLADILSLSVREARKSIRNINAADVGWRALMPDQYVL